MKDNCRAAGGPSPVVPLDGNQLGVVIVVYRDDAALPRRDAIHALLKPIADRVVDPHAPRAPTNQVAERPEEEDQE